MPKDEDVETEGEVKVICPTAEVGVSAAQSNELTNLR